METNSYLGLLKNDKRGLLVGHFGGPGDSHDADHQTWLEAATYGASPLTEFVRGMKEDGFVEITRNIPVATSLGRRSHFA